MKDNVRKAYFHLPGLFEFYELYDKFLALCVKHREYFYDWCEIASIYGAPEDCIWGGGRACIGDCSPARAASLLKKYGISARLTFSNSRLSKEHLTDKRCNELCRIFENTGLDNGIIIYSDMLLDYIKEKYPSFYFISSTTKVITEYDKLVSELGREDFSFVVPDFRFNKRLEELAALPAELKGKLELLCNECCWEGCTDRKACYENVSMKCLGEPCSEHICKAPGAKDGYRFSKAMENPAFIGIDDIQKVYLPMGINNFKIEGRGLGSALILEFLLYYLTKPEYQLKVREDIYLDSCLDLF